MLSWHFTWKKSQDHFCLHCKRLVKTWQQYPSAAKRSHLCGAILSRDCKENTHPEEGLWCHYLEACCIPVCVRVRHIRKTSPLQACTAFSVSFRNSRHTLTAAKYQNEESVDKLFLQTSVFSSCCRDCVLLCIYGHTFTVCEKCRDFHFTFMKAAFFFFWWSYASALVSTGHVFTAGFHGHQPLTLYIALCLRVGKLPLIWVSKMPRGASHLESHETFPLS